MLEAEGMRTDGPVADTTKEQSLSTSQAEQAQIGADESLRRDISVSAGLSNEQLEVLMRWTQAADKRQSRRAHIILLSARGFSASEVGRALGLGVPTIYKWRRRFARLGLSGLFDRPRSGQPRRLPKELRDEIARATSREQPPVGERWSIRLAARHFGVTQHQIRKVWMEAGLRPHAEGPAEGETK